MEDIRDEVINSDDLLTEDSSDELKDLVKEFEVKYHQLKSKKEKKEKKEKKDIITQIPQSIAKTDVISNISRDITCNSDAVASISQVKPSTFLNKLYNTNFQAKTINIDYDKRKFEFDTTNTSFHKVEVNEKEPMTGLYLRKRFISHDQLTNLIQSTDPNMKFLKIDKLLAKVNKSNNFAEPMYTNWCLITMIISKSSPLLTKSNKKYIKVKLGSFMHSIDLLVFDQAFEKNWKLQPGNLVMILNPIIKKYEINGKSGFNLKLDNTNVESLIEIGSLRDFGYCKNDNCKNVINTKTSELCDVHVDLKYKHSGRMELNGAVQMRSPKKFKKQIHNDNYFKEYNEDTVISTGVTPDFNKYQNPKVLQTQIKRRKLLDLRANKKLEKKLSKISSLSNLIFKNDSPRIPETSQGFPNSMISKIGYDPTQQDSNQSKKENNRMKELYELSRQQSKSKSLSSSQQDVQNKLVKFKLNLKNLKDYDKSVNSKPLFIPKEKVLIHSRNKRNRVEDDDSDDDIDIEFGDEQSKREYLKLVRK